MAKINLKQSWRPWKAGLIHSGIYRIPQDMSAEMAAKAVSEGVGEMMPDEPPRKQGRRYGKAPAPENKVLQAPEENKSDEIGDVTSED